MQKARYLVLGLFLASATTQPTAQEKKTDPLQPILFLEGTWHGEGKGPYGTYEFETKVERRGRWLLLTSNVFFPNTDSLMFVSTQVYGYDEQGLVLQLFDTAGAFEFRGESVESGVRFEWKEGDRYKRVEIGLRDGRLHSRYDALEPSMFPEPVKFEGEWLPGVRPKQEP